ncbi:hypothetical protein ACFIN9_26485 [Streptomyces noursei]|uniref:hypothetical protein n=1 Tax=Streptomyces noursei TaxID=1971 RepID=UPI0036D20B80
MTALTRFATSELPSDCAAAHALNLSLRAHGIAANAAATVDGAVAMGTIKPFEALALYECLTGRPDGTAAHALDLHDLQDLRTLAELVEIAVGRAARRRIVMAVRLDPEPELVLDAGTPLSAVATLTQAIKSAQRPTAATALPRLPGAAGRGDRW